MRSLKTALQRQELTIGSWITLAHPAVAEIMAGAGFDWLAVDLEHSVITIRETEELIRVIRLGGVTPLVRVAANDPVQIKRVMDAGAHGVIVPMVNSRQDAERAVAGAYYPPRGTRGVGLARAQGYGAQFDAYVKWLGKEGVVIVQVEHRQAVERLDDILGVPGVDGFLVGPYDLSGSFGVPGEFDHPSMTGALQTLRKAMGRRRVAAGFHVIPPRPELVIEKAREGYRFIAYSLDTLFLGELCRGGLATIKKALAAGRSRAKARAG